MYNKDDNLSYHEGKRMSWDQILDLPYDLVSPILLPVVAYYRDDVTANAYYSLS